VTRGGVNTGVDAQDQNKESQFWIQKKTHPQQQFDVNKEKETFKEAKNEFLKRMKNPHQTLHRGMILLFFICLNLWIKLTRKIKQRK
jgi:hypothetical protein